MGVLNLVAVAIDGVLLEVDVDADRAIDYGDLVGTVTVVHEKVGIPFARRGVLDGDTLDVADDLAVKAYRDIAYL
jgi:hypothetical protein